MTVHIATTFRVPLTIVGLAALAGIRVLSQSNLGASALKQYAAVDTEVWASAQIAARRAFTKVRDSSATPVPTACRLMGLDERYGRDAVGQWLAQDTLYRLNFVHICRHAFPDAIVIADFAPPLRQALAAEGFRFSAALSRLAWMARRASLVATALAAHGAHLVLRVLDEKQPVTLGLAGDAPLALWPGVYDVELSAAEDGINVSDFVASRSDIFPPGETILCEGNPALRHAPPVTVVRKLFAFRRTGRSGLRATLRDMGLQLRLAWATVAGGWVEAMMGRECAKLPRARACLSNLRPRTIYATIASLQYLSFWLAPARQAGAPVRMLCTSTQVFPVQNGTMAIPGIVPDIYMLPSADEYLVWDDAHAADLAAAGARAGAVYAVGPIVLSGPMPDRPPAAPGTVIIDYFDQPPASDAYLIRIGAPTIYHSPERALAALDDVLTAVKRAFGDRAWQLRIKTKRGGSSQIDARYTERLTELAGARDDRVVLLAPETSPLSMHAEADATLGFPFVSPVVSAAMSGCPSAFFDAGGLPCTSGALRDIPLLRDVDALAAWLETTMTEPQGRADGFPARGDRIVRPTS